MKIIYDKQYAGEWYPSSWGETDATGAIRPAKRILINERAFTNSGARSARKNAPICPRSEREMKLRQTRIWSAASAVARARNLGGARTKRSEGRRLMTVTAVSWFPLKRFTPPCVACKSNIRLASPKVLALANEKPERLFTLSRSSRLHF